MHMWWATLLHLAVVPCQYCTWAHVQVGLLRSAGALVLGKGNCGEFMFDPDQNVGSAFGVTRNPYGPDYTTAGALCVQLLQPGAIQNRRLARLQVQVAARPLRWLPILLLQP